MIRFLTPVLLTALFAVACQAARPLPDVTVAADGSGNHATIQEAINAAPQGRTADAPWVILVQPGRYDEIVYVQREKVHVKLVGADPATTLLTGALCYGLLTIPALRLVKYAKE